MRGVNASEWSHDALGRICVYHRGGDRSAYWCAPMRSRPVVSIAMPVRNSRSDWFHAALDSLLDQDVENFEIIISDNASDAASEAAYRDAAKKDLRIRYIRHDVEMPAEDNFRFNIMEAKGDFFFWAADDDVRAPSFIRRTLALLEAQPSAGLANCLTGFIDENGDRIGTIPIPSETDSLFVKDRLAALRNPGFYMDIYGLYRLAVLRQIENIRWNGWGVDNVLVFAMLLHGPIPRVQEELFYYRVRSNRAESLAAALISENARADDVRFQWESERSKDLMRVFLKSRLSNREKMLCLPIVATTLLGSPFVDERRRVMRYRYGRAIAEGAYPSALGAALKYAALSPAALLRFSAWRLAFEEWKQRRSPT
jgi:glycosyltransferase involved in cell wall biosynthesis